MIPASALTAPFRLGYRRDVQRLYTASRPDVVLLLQGRIEATTVPMLALPRHADVVSYIPMAHSGPDLGKGRIVGGALDLIKRLYYRRPQRLIVPSRAVAEQLRRAGAVGTIFVVPNHVPALETRGRETVRAALGIAPEEKVALFLARFDTYQKGVDTLVAAIAADAERLAHWRLLFVGTGPGGALIETLRARHPELRITVLGWADNGREILRASDVLLLPSRFEGVPLSMLEALDDGVPILASEIDVFEEYLPAAWRWDYKTAPGLAARLDGLPDGAGTGTAARADGDADATARQLRNAARLFETALLSDADAPAPPI